MDVNFERAQSSTAALLGIDDQRIEEALEETTPTTKKGPRIKKIYLVETNRTNTLPGDIWLKKLGVDTYMCSEHGLIRTKKSIGYTKKNGDMFCRVCFPHYVEKNKPTFETKAGDFLPSLIDEVLLLRCGLRMVVDSIYGPKGMIVGHIPSLNNLQVYWFNSGRFNLESIHDLDIMDLKLLQKHVCKAGRFSKILPEKIDDQENEEEIDMPLIKGAKPGTKSFKKNIEAEILSGKPPKQAVAIAYSESGEDKGAEEKPKHKPGKGRTVTLFPKGKKK